MTICLMDHADVAVEDLAAAITLFVELSLKLKGETDSQTAWRFQR